MYHIVIKNIKTGDYDTPDTSNLYHKGDIFPTIDGEQWIVISGKVLPSREV